MLAAREPTFQCQPGVAVVGLPAVPFIACPHSAVLAPVGQVHDHADDGPDEEGIQVAIPSENIIAAQIAAPRMQVT